MPKLPPAPPFARTLAAPDVRLPQEVQGLASSVRHGRRFLVAQVRGHRRDRPGLGVLVQADVLRVGSQGDARRREDPVALPERPDLLAHRVDVTGELLPEHTSSRSADAERQPHGHPDPGGEVKSPQLTIGRAHRRGADPEPAPRCPSERLQHVPELENIRWSVVRADDCSHGSPVRAFAALVGWEDRSRPYVTATTTLPRLCPLSTTYAPRRCRPEHRCGRSQA